MAEIKKENYYTSINDGEGIEGKWSLEGYVLPTTYLAMRKVKKIAPTYAKSSGSKTLEVVIGSQGGSEFGKGFDCFYIDEDGQALAFENKSDKLGYQFGGRVTIYPIYSPYADYVRAAEKRNAGAGKGKPATIIKFGGKEYVWVNQAQCKTAYEGEESVQLCMELVSVDSIATKDKEPTYKDYVDFVFGKDGKSLTEVEAKALCKVTLQKGKVGTRKDPTTGKETPIIEFKIQGFKEQEDRKEEQKTFGERVIGILKRGADAKNVAEQDKKALADVSKERETAQNNYSAAKERVTRLEQAIEAAEKENNAIDVNVGEITSFMENLLKYYKNFPPKESKEDTGGLEKIPNDIVKNFFSEAEKSLKTLQDESSSLSKERKAALKTACERVLEGKGDEVISGTKTKEKPDGEKYIDLVFGRYSEIIKAKNGKKQDVEKLTKEKKQEEEKINKASNAYKDADERCKIAKLKYDGGYNDKGERVEGSREVAYSAGQEQLEQFKLLTKPEKQIDKALAPKQLKKDKERYDQERDEKEQKFLDIQKEYSEHTKTPSIEKLPETEGEDEFVSPIDSENHNEPKNEKKFHGPFGSLRKKWQEKQDAKRNTLLQNMEKEEAAREESLRRIFGLDEFEKSESEDSANNNPPVVK